MLHLLSASPPQYLFRFSSPQFSSWRRQRAKAERERKNPQNHELSPSLDCFWSIQSQRARPQHCRRNRFDRKIWNAPQHGALSVSLLFYGPEISCYFIFIHIYAPPSDEPTQWSLGLIEWRLRRITSTTNFHFPSSARRRRPDDALTETEPNTIEIKERPGEGRRAARGGEIEVDKNNNYKRTFHG